MIQEVICLAVPAELHPDTYLGHPDAAVRTAFIGKISDTAHATVWSQWERGAAPLDVEWDSIDWTITDLADDIRAFVPIHECLECWRGVARAETFLRRNPDRWVALGNLSYTPVWPFKEKQ